MKKFLIHIVIFIPVLQVCNNSYAQDLEGMGIRKGVKATGGVSLSNIIYNTNDSVNRRDPYQLILSGNLNINIFGYDAPFSFIYSNSQRSYTQPFNRLSFTPRYKWIKAYIGQTSMTFSPYTLSGHSFKGAGLELTPGSWRLSMMGGQMRKAVEYTPLAENASQPSYKRMGYGVKFGYEKGSSGILVNLFSARDFESSIREVPENVLLHPMENIAAGISGRTSLFGHFTLEGEYSISMLNSDTRLMTATDSADVNSNSFSAATAGSRRFDAYSAGAGWQAPVAGIMLKYERVAPDYQSLGAYYFNNDLENLTIAPSLRLLDGRFTINGNAGVQRNNLDASRESTTRRFVGAGNLNFSISERWNMTFNFSNFSTYTNMKPREDPFFRDNMDSLNFYQITNQAGGSVNYVFGKKESPGNLMLFTSFQKANDAGSRKGTDFLASNASYSQVLGSDVTISFLYNLNSSDSEDMKSLYHGPGLTLSRVFKEKGIRASVNSTYNRNVVNGIKGSPVLSTGINLNWMVGKSEAEKHNVTSNISWVQRFRSGLQGSRREITATVNYSYSF